VLIIKPTCVISEIKIGREERRREERGIQPYICMGGIDY